MLATLSVREKLEYMSELNIDILIERKICGMNQEVTSRSGANVNSYWHSEACLYLMKCHIFMSIIYPEGVMADGLMEPLKVSGQGNQSKNIFI